MAKANRSAYVFLPEQYSVCFDNYLISGISYVEDSYKIDRPDSDRSIIEYVLQGSGTLVAPDGHKYILQKGDTYYLPKGTDHLYYTNNDQEQWAKIFINFGGNLFTNLIADFGIGEQYVYPGLHIYDEMSEIYNLVKSEGDDTEQKCCSLIFQIIYKMYAVTTHQNSETLSDAAKLKAYIDKNFSSKLEMKDLSAVIFKSESQVIRLFKQKYGITPHQYMIKKKIEAAKILLKRTKLPIKVISYKLSFADEFYFSNAFKKAEGISPKEYRQREQV